jgi:hypothetical protein
MARSPAMERFVRSLSATGRDAEDGYDVDAARMLEGDERREAEDLLLARLAQSDGHAAAALGELSVARALDPLRAALARDRGALPQIAIARALHRLGDDRGLASVAAVLRGSGSPSERVVAAAIARELGPTLVRPLIDALSDADGTVRTNAAVSLARLHGHRGAAMNFRDPIGLLTLLLDSPLPSVAALARAELLAVFDPQGAGCALPPHADAALVAAQRTLLLAATNEERAAAVAALPADARPWVARTLLASVHRNPRSAPALAALGDRIAVEPLREAAAMRAGEIATAAAAALQVLDARATP